MAYSDENWEILCFTNCFLPRFWQGILINVNMKILCANNGLWYYLIASLSPPFTRQTLSQRETRRLWDVIKHSVLIFTGLIGTMNSSGWKLRIASAVLNSPNADEGIIRVTVSLLHNGKSIQSLETISSFFHRRTELNLVSPTITLSFIQFTLCYLEANWV